MIPQLKNIFSLIKTIKKQEKLSFSIEKLNDLQSNTETCLLIDYDLQKTNLDIDFSDICLIGRTLFGLLADIEDMELNIKEFAYILKKITLEITKKIDHSKTISYVKSTKLYNQKNKETAQLQDTLKNIMKFLYSILKQHKIIAIPTQIVLLQNKHINNLEKNSLDISTEINSINKKNINEIQKTLSFIHEKLEKCNHTFTNLAKIISKIALQFNYDHCN